MIPVLPPLALDVRMTENTAELNVGEGMLWRSKVEPTSFKIVIADPVFGQVAEQTALENRRPGRAGGDPPENRPQPNRGDCTERESGPAAWTRRRSRCSLRRGRARRRRRAGFKNRRDVLIWAGELLLRLA